MAPHILVVGQNQANLALIRAAVARRDCQLVLAPGESLALFLAQKKLPDLIISDFTLSDGDGLSFLHEVRADEKLKVVPFIFLIAAPIETALKNKLLAQKAVVCKSSDSKEFIANLEKFFDRDSGRKSGF